MFEDKILKGGEITQQGNFKPQGGACYLMLVPKSGVTETIYVMNVKLSRNDSLSDFPFAVGTWNPVVLNEINVKSEDLTKFRIFWGITG